MTCCRTTCRRGRSWRARANSCGSRGSSRGRRNRGCLSRHGRSAGLGTSRRGRSNERLCNGLFARISLSRFRCFFSGCNIAEMLAHQFCVLQINRTRVRLFFGDADFRQELNQDFRLDLQLPRQFINPDLIRICHSPRSSLILTTLRCQLQFRNSKRHTLLRGARAKPYQCPLQEQ